MNYEKAEMQLVLLERCNVVMALSGLTTGDDSGVSIDDLDIGTCSADDN